MILKIVLFLISVKNTYCVPTPCNHVLTENTGSVQSPSYPKAYPNSLNCSWKIVVPIGSQIVLITNFFDVEGSYNCESDALYIYDGSNENAKLYSTPFCGRKGPNQVKSSGNSLFLRFITDALDNAGGFYIQYSAKKVCDYEFHGISGIFTSPRFPNNYYENANCTYRIKTTKTQAIILHFHHFALENAVNGDCLDYVAIYDVLSSGTKLLKKMCGVGIPPPIRSFSNEILVKFHSDNLINSPGFNASFKSFFHLCENNNFKCGNGLCVNVNLLCNSVNDCLDNTDEVFCSCYRFKCKNYRCVNHENVCDGVNHCGDWSDEDHCHGGVDSTVAPSVSKTTAGRSIVTAPFTTPMLTCRVTEFTCTNLNCIDLTDKCDGDDDCGDNSDESDCYGQCKNMNGGCQHICEYSIKTGVKCSCYDGFQIDSNGLSCIDINECSSRPCADICENVFGSYKCSCTAGYRLHQDRHNCTDFDECSLKKGLCQQRCINTIGSYECSCFHGYWHDKQLNKCTDFNECEIENGGCAEKCVNTIGSFECTCNKTGYVKTPGKALCEEVNECELGTTRCSQHCFNTDGSYRCECRPGYRLAYDNHNCLDVDECLEGVPGCWGNCINTLGSYYCRCDIGFKAIINNTKCDDIDECEFNSGGCSNLCINTPGSFYCKCHTGYIARDPRSFTCEDVNECEASPCQEECINTPGSYRCLCQPGYQISNRTKCEDVNECEASENVCSYKCTNTLGSYFCLCPDGYILNSDKKTCIKTVSGTGCHRLRIDRNLILSSDWTKVNGGWAWQAFLSVHFKSFKFPRFKCMATLIHRRYVLTTSHCVRYGYINIEPEQLVITLGSYLFGNMSASNATQNIKAEKVIYHKLLDLALIQLERDVTLSKYVQPLCLVQSEYDVDLSLNQEIVAATWPPSTIGFQFQQIYTTIEKPSLCKWSGVQMFTKEHSICVKFHHQQTFLPMGGTPLLGMLRSTSSTDEAQKWYFAGVLVYGDSYPGRRPTFSSAYEYVGFHKASTLIKWLKKEIQAKRNESHSMLL